MTEEIKKICECGHELNDHSYPYTSEGGYEDNLDCDKCECKSFKLSGKKVIKDKLKTKETLKDLKSLLIKGKIVIDYDELKAKSVKWIKEDIKFFENTDFGEWDLIERWMDRLNIEEEDLK